MSYREADKTLWDALKWHILLLVLGIIVAAYIAGMIRAMSNGHFIDCYLPSSIITSVKEKGFPFAIFLLLCIPIGYYVGKKALIRYKRFVKTEQVNNSQRSQTGTPYGDAHFESPAEYQTEALVQDIEDAEGIIYGKLDRDENGAHKVINRRMGTEAVVTINRNAAIVGASGWGKSICVTGPAILQAAKRQESLVLTDPDGGLYRRYAKLCSALGLETFRFDLGNPIISDGWDCLNALKGATLMETENNVEQFASSVIDNIADRPKEIYGTGPKAILKAYILYCLLDPTRDEKDKTFGAVFKCMKSDADDFLEKSRKRFNMSDMHPEQRPAFNAFLSFVSSNENLRGNLLTNLTSAMGAMDVSGIDTLFSRNDIDMRRLGNVPTVVFCVFPENDSAYRFIVAMFFTMFFRSLYSYSDTCPGGKLPIHTNFILDEFACLGSLFDFDNKISTCRKHNISFTLLFQTFEQLRNRYPLCYNTILTCCDTVLVMGANDDETAKWVEERCGTMTVEVTTAHVDVSKREAFESRQYSDSVNVGQGKTPLISMDRAYRMKRNDVIIIFHGHYPIWAKKFRYWEHPYAYNIKEYEQNDNSWIPPVTDRDARKAWRDEQTRQVQEYRKIHPLLTSVQREYRHYDKGYFTVTAGPQPRRPRTIETLHWEEAEKRRLEDRKAHIKARKEYEKKKAREEKVSYIQYNIFFFRKRLRIFLSPILKLFHIELKPLNFYDRYEMVAEFQNQQGYVGNKEAETMDELAYEEYEIVEEPSNFVKVYPIEQSAQAANQLVPNETQHPEDQYQVRSHSQLNQSANDQAWQKKSQSMESSNHQPIAAPEEKDHVPIQEASSQDEVRAASESSAELNKPSLPSRSASRADETPDEFQERMKKERQKRAEQKNTILSVKSKQRSAYTMPPKKTNTITKEMEL